MLRKLLGFLILPSLAMPVYAETTCDYKINRNTNQKGRFLVKKKYVTMKKECGLNIQKFESSSSDEKRKTTEECFSKISSRVKNHIENLNKIKDIKELSSDSLVSNNSTYKNYLARLMKRKNSKISDFNLNRLVTNSFFSGSELETLKNSENSVVEAKAAGFQSIEDHFRMSQWTKKNEEEKNRVGYYDNFIYHEGQIKAIAQNDKDAEVLNAIVPAKKIDLADYEILKQGKILPAMNSEDYPLDAIYGSDFVLLKNKETGNVKLYEVSGERKSNIRRVKSEKDIPLGKATNFSYTRKFQKGRVTVKYTGTITCNP